MKWGRIILIAIVLLVVFIIGRGVANALYFERRAELTSAIDGATDALSTFRRISREEYPPIEEQLQAITDRTLGPTRETVEAELRARLNRIVERVALAEASVSTGQHRLIGSPAGRDPELRRLPREWRDTPDYAEQQATVRGVGTLEQAMRLVDRIQSAGWTKRIDSLELDPKADAAHFEVVLRLTTLYIPGRTPQREVGSPPYDGSGYERVASLVAANPFRKPAPPDEPTQPAEEAVAQEPPPPAFPYGEWKVTAIARGSGGPEVWLLNTTQNKSKTLFIGQSIGEIEFVSASSEEATFRIGESEFTVAVGATLNQRSQIQAQ